MALECPAISSANNSPDFKIVGSWTVEPAQALSLTYKRGFQRCQQVSPSLSVFLYVPLVPAADGLECCLAVAPEAAIGA